ncbi:MAG TPA: phosphatase PAP2 family protein [Allosphingosinicella sp.]|nr:phosphatase PAP2 family protein [Allosphingosinicella sp.]
MKRPARATTLALAGAGLLFAAAGIASLDGIVVRALPPGGLEARWLDLFVDGADWVSGKEISNFLLGPVLILIGLALNLRGKRRLLSGAWLYVGAAQFAATCLGDFSKPLFGRLRPFQALQGGAWHDRWFMGPDYGSFPSGHAAFYFGLFVPLALAAPRWGLPLLAVPLLIALERVISLDHYLSDVAASMALAALLAWLFGKWLAGRPASLAAAPKAGL